ncbi:hypothetical protein [Paenibacillus sp. DMB20]|uniref:hypothetical protein n=1 Tax=Paenibacillus sp. DMB20 TaxID=1642570 RepID=UPI00069A25D1|nr:hypothetical protein [Paenibacillus sp. DMB20]
MIKIGMMIFYEVDTGRVLMHTPAQEYPEHFPVRTVEDTIKNYPLLRDRDRSTYGVLQLEYGQYMEDFMEASSFQVDPKTKKLLFTYRDPNNPEVPPPTLQPLSEQVAQLKAQLSEAQAAAIELHESQAAQDAKIAEANSATLELYEMLAGGVGA